IALLLRSVTCSAAQTHLPTDETDAVSQPVPSAASASITARLILDRVRPSVIQIKGFFGTNTAEAFHGSGFAVTDRGVFITNWHVVSDVVLYPEKYRLQDRTPPRQTRRVAEGRRRPRQPGRGGRAPDGPPPRLGARRRRGLRAAATAASAERGHRGRARL